METAKRRDNGCIPLGILGALVCSLVGGAAYVGVYRLGFIAGFCSYLMVTLANIGYTLFARPSRKHSTAGLAVSAVMMILVTLAAEYVCLVYKVYANCLAAQMDVTFFGLFGTLTTYYDTNVLGKAVGWDLLFAFVFGTLAVVWNFMQLRKEQRAKEAPAEETPAEDVSVEEVPVEDAVAGSARALDLPEEELVILNNPGRTTESKTDEMTAEEAEETALTTDEQTE